MSKCEGEAARQHVSQVTLPTASDVRELISLRKSKVIFFRLVTQRPVTSENACRKKKAERYPTAPLEEMCSACLKNLHALHSSRPLMFDMMDLLACVGRTGCICVEEKAVGTNYSPACEPDRTEAGP